MPTTEQKIETEIEVTLSMIQDLMGEFLWNQVNSTIDGIISDEEYEIVKSEPSSITLKVTGYVVGE